MKCRQEGSVLYKIEAGEFFKNVVVLENPIERVEELLKRKHKGKKI